MDDMCQIAENLRKETDRLEKRIRQSDAWEKGQEAWENIKGQGEEVLSRARRKSEEVWKDGQTVMRKYPGRSVGLAILAGAAIGFLIGRQDD